MVRVIVAACALALFCASAGAAAVEDPIEPKVESAFTPQAMPARGQTAVRHTLSLHFNAGGGAPLPALKELEFLEDRDVRLHLEGLPICPTGQIDLPRNKSREELCAPAQIGSGQMSVIISFPEQAPTLVHAGVRIFNTIGRRPSILVTAYLGKPVTGEISIRLESRGLSRGRYGLKFSGAVPQIAGSGAISHLTLHFRKGIFSAACPGDGRLRTKVGASFADGTEISALTSGRCHTGRRR